MYRVRCNNAECKDKCVNQWWFVTNHKPQRLHTCGIEIIESVEFVPIVFEVDPNCKELVESALSELISFKAKLEDVKNG